MRWNLFVKGRFFSFPLLIATVMTVSLLSACGSKSTETTKSATNTPAITSASAIKTPAASTQPAETKALTKVSLVNSWFPDAERAGQYTALEKGFYKEGGLDMTITPGGPQISKISMVATGNKDFGMAQADELLVARKEGIPVVALFAIFQTNPQAIMYHTEEKSIKSFSDLNGRTVYTAQGAMYWEYIKRAYKLDKVKEMAYVGNYSGFLADKTQGIQSYITSDPIIFKTKKVDVSFLSIDEAGYQPYANVLFTTEKMIKDKPEVVKEFVKASARGWDYYKNNYDEINPIINKLNPDNSLEVLKATAENEMKYIYTREALTGGVGMMTEARWMALGKQLVDIGMIPNTDEVKNVFTTKFLPK